MAGLLDKDNILPSVAVILVIAVLIGAFAPKEQTLGSSVKLVYFHASLMWVAYILYTISGFLALVHLIGASEPIYYKVQALFQTALIILLITGLLGTLVAIITWGGVFWQEPRLAMLIEIVLISVAAVVLANLSGAPRVGSLAVLFAVVANWLLLLRTERVVHPTNPIFRSPVLAIKIFPIIITLVLLIMAIQLSRLFLPTKKEALKN